MTRLWRLCRRAYAVLDGEGARLFGGRWNLPGNAVVYTSATASLAALEYFVNLDPEDAPSDLVLVPADLPEDASIEVVARDQLPGTWRKTPAPDALARLGTDWLRSRRSLALSVPSVVVPQERNFLLNPAHPDFTRMIIGRREPFSFDPRMWR